jgi:hypothetical protein
LIDSSALDRPLFYVVARTTFGKYYQLRINVEIILFAFVEPHMIPEARQAICRSQGTYCINKLVDGLQLSL